MKKTERKKRGAPREDTALARLERSARQMPPAEWRRAVKRLARDVQAVEPLTHEQCEETLPWYLSDAQRGENVREMYPAVWRHLQSCHRCKETHALLREALQEDSSLSAAPTVPGRPLALLNPAPHQAWYKQKAPQLMGAKPVINFLFNPTHLRKIFLPEPSLGSRGEDSADAKGLLLHDHFMIDGQRLEVEAHLIPSPYIEGRFHIHLLVMSPAPLPRTLRAELQWGDQRHTMYLTAGETTFEDISRPDFTKPYLDIPTPQFRLTLEAVPDERKRKD